MNYPRTYQESIVECAVMWVNFSVLVVLLASCLYEKPNQPYGFFFFFALLSSLLRVIESPYWKSSPANSEREA